MKKKGHWKEKLVGSGGYSWVFGRPMYDLWASKLKLTKFLSLSLSLQIAAPAKKEKSKPLSLPDYPS